MTEDQLLKMIEQHHGKAKKGAKGWYNIKCPTCTPRDAKKMKRGVNLKRMTTNCFICEIPLYVKDLIGDETIERVEHSDVEEPQPEHPQARDIPCTGVIPMHQLEPSHPARQLFEKDFLLDMQTYWDKYEIGFIPKEGAIDLVFEKGKINTADALVFPVRYKDELVGWQLRFVPGTPNGDRMKKIRYMHLFKKGEYLYNYDNAIKHERVIVVEGVKKALKFPNAVATWGKGITDEQILLLLRWKKIIFLYDGEDNTQQKTRDLVDQFIFGGRQAININPASYGYPSPDEMSVEVAQEIVQKEWKAKYDI